RNAPSATGSSRKGVDNGLARYGAMGARFAKPSSTPTQTTHRCQKRDISTKPEKGTPLLCLDRGTVSTSRSVGLSDRDSSTAFGKGRIFLSSRRMHGSELRLTRDFELTERL